MAGVSCSLCRDIINDVDECKVCSDGHKFHKKCINDYWKTQVNRTRPNILRCPVSNSILDGDSDWKNCTDLHSGGKRRKRRYSKKNKKNHKKYFSKSKKRK